jgi:drug/metabolite transporter (DMT)-like permease
MSLRLLSQLLLLGAIWGASFLFMRVAVAEFTPLALIEVRVAIGAIFLTSILAIQGKLSSLRGRTKQFLILGALNSAIPFSLFAFAVKHQTAGLSSVLNSTSPLFGALVAFVWLGERLRVIQVVGLILGFCGVVILAMSKNTLDGKLIAVAAGLLAAMLYGIAAHYSKRSFQGCPPLAVSSGSLIGASVFLLPAMPWSMSEHVPSLKAWACTLALGVVCTGVAYILYFRMIEFYGASRSMVVAYLIPIFGVLWGFLFLEESINTSMLVGGSIVLAGTILVSRNKAKVAS